MKFLALSKMSPMNFYWSDPYSSEVPIPVGILIIIAGMVIGCFCGGVVKFFELLHPAIAWSVVALITVCLFADPVDDLKDNRCVISKFLFSALVALPMFLVKIFVYVDIVTVIVPAAKFIIRLNF